MTNLFSPTTYSETVSPTKTDHSSAMRRATGLSSTVTKSRGTTQFLEEEEDDDGGAVAFDAQESGRPEEKGDKSQEEEEIQAKSQTASPPKQVRIG